MRARLAALARRVDGFLVGGRLLAAMSLLHSAALLAYSLLLPPTRRLEGVALAIVCLAAAVVIARVNLSALPLEQPRSLLVGLLLAGGALYAVLAAPWPDEASILAAAQDAAQKGALVFLQDYAAQPWAGTRHPPLMTLLNGALLNVTGADGNAGLLALRMASLLLTAVTLLVTERAARELFGVRSGLLAAALLLAMPATLRVGATALSDVFVAGLVSAALLCLWRAGRGGLHWALLAGLIAGVGLLVKYTAGLFFAAAGVWLLMPQTSRGERARRVRGLALAGLVAGALLGGWLLLAARLGVFAQQSAQVGEYARMVATDEFGRGLLARTLLFSLPAALGIHLLPLLMKALAQMMHAPSRAAALAWGWAAAVMLPVLLTLPDFRYLLAAFPALAALAADALSAESAETRARVALLGLVCAAALLWMLNRAAPSAVVPFS